MTRHLQPREGDKGDHEYDEHSRIYTPGRFALQLPSGDE
jgi:hypothetical protein